MVGIAPEVMSHRLNVDLGYKLVLQKRRPITPECYAALKEEVDKLGEQVHQRGTLPDLGSQPRFGKEEELKVENVCRLH